MERARLDYGVALQTADKEEYQQQIKQISAIAKEAGIYFIFSSTCPYCIQQAKILSHFENTYGVSVFPLTLDNVGLEEYPAPQAGTQMADKLNITKTPTLILAYPASGKMIPLAAGLVTEKELIRRLIILNQKKEAP
jgi:conjugal transfer pilus assembly protein TraF